MPIIVFLSTWANDLSSRIRNIIVFTNGTQSRRSNVVSYFLNDGPVDYVKLLRDG